MINEDVLLHKGIAVVVFWSVRRALTQRFYAWLHSDLFVTLNQGSGMEPIIDMLHVFWLCKTSFVLVTVRSVAAVVGFPGG